MPDIDFPVNPSLNATYSKDGKTWIWDGSRWRTNNILSYSGGGTGYASYTTGDLLVGTGNSLIKFPVGQNNFQYLKVDSIYSASGVTWISLPLAGVGQSGLVSTLDQTFEGTKTFSSTISGNLSGTATTSENVNVTTTTRSLTHYLTFTNQTSGSGLALTTSTIGIGFTVNPAQNTLAAGTFIGNLSGTAVTATNFYGALTGNFTGTATTSENVNVTTTTRSLTHYLTFTNQTSGSGLALTTSAIGIGFTVNPAQNTLAAGKFIGNLSGTAVTATNFYGILTGNVTGTATTSENVNVTTTTRSLTHYLIFTNAANGSGLALTTSTIGIGFTVNPSQNTLAAGIFIGNLSGTAATATNFYGTLTGNVTGTATTSQNVNVTTTTRSLTHYLTFTNATNGSGLALTTSAIGIGFTVNPAQNTLAAGIFIGNLSGTAATATNFYGALTGNITGTATTSQSINVNTTTINQNHYLLFSNRSSGSGVALTTSTIGIGFTVNPAENTLSAGLFAGNISGTAATFANIYGNTFGSLTGVEFSGGDVLIKTGKSLKIYEATNVYNTSFKANSSLAGNTDYTLPVGKPGTGASILQSDTAGSMIWVKAASNKATYVLSFGAGFTPTTGLDSVSIAIPYANDGSTSLTYTIKRVEVRTETAPGASTLAFFFERHTTGDVTWASANTIKGAASANFSVASTNFSSSFTTITSSSGNNGEVASGNYLRVNFASVGSAANVSISIMIQEN